MAAKWDFLESWDMAGSPDKKLGVRVITAPRKPAHLKVITIYVRDKAHS